MINRLNQMTNKLIKDMDEETWRKFVAYCKIKNVKVSEELNTVLIEHLKKNFSRLFEK